MSEIGGDEIGACGKGCGVKSACAWPKRHADVQNFAAKHGMAAFLPALCGAQTVCA